MNQNPEQLARDRKDGQLTACGWILQNKISMNLAAGIGVALREYQTDGVPVDYILFVNRKPVGLIEVEQEEEGVRLITLEEQSTEYASAKLKYINNDPLPFVYENIGEVKRFTDYGDLKPRSRPVFTFHRPQTFEILLRENKTLWFFVNSFPL